MTHATPLSPRLAVGTLLIAALSASSGVAIAQTPQLEALNSIGLQRARSYFSPEPWEHYDTVTGNVMLTFTDLVLPGNAGRQLAFQRTYNNSMPTGTNPVSRWTFGIAGVPIQVIEQVVPDAFPIGTSDVNALMSTTPKLVMADGSRQPTLYIARPASVVAARDADVISPSFVKYNRSAHLLTMPDGTICNYDSSSGRLLSIVDRFQNVISFSWSQTTLVVTQDLQNNQVRTITLTLDGQSRVTGIQFDGKTWQYEYNHDMNGVLDITTVTLPNGSQWAFTYDQRDLRTATTPFGGQVEYEYLDFQIFPDPNNTAYSVDQHTLRFRRSGGRDVTQGEWQIVWDTQGQQYAWTTQIFTPSGKQVSYRHDVQVVDQTHIIGGNFGVVDRTIWSGSFSQSGQWLAGQQLELEHSTYQVVKVVDFSPFEWWGTIEPATHTLTREGRDYTTQVGFSPSNFGDYHNPNEIVETGHITRTTTRHYTHDVSTGILGLPTSEEVTVGSETFRREWTWATLSGFKTSETSWYLLGSSGARLTTGFLPDTRGNTYRVTPSSGLPTYLGYDWGRVSSVQTPEHTTSRNINMNGTMESETIAGRTTTFQYDPLFRPTVTQPPGGTNPIITTYNDATGTIRQQRGTSDVSTLVDGFGRVIATTDSTGVNNTTEYDAEGRVRRVGYPFRIGDPYIVKTISYDGLDRVTTQLNPDGSSGLQTYGDGTVTSRDENGHYTVRQFQAFGHPDDSRLVSLTDADAKTWTYLYNGLGQLKRVTAPDGIMRTWQYNTNAQLAQETHPESGATTYLYDAAGRLAQKTDAKQMAFVYTYDGNSRLKTITAGTEVTTFAYETGTDNRASASVGTTSSTVTYDAAGRPSTRTDTVDGHRFTTTYGYDANDNPTSVWYPSFGAGGDRRRIGYDYDSEHRISRVFDLQATRDFAKEFVYHASGALSSYKAGNNVQTTFAYDPNRYWMTSLNVGELWSLGYQNYDGVGNVRAINDSRPGMNQTLAYDGLDRLLAVSSSGYPSVSYTYDAHGNRTSASGVTYTYYSGKLRLQTQGSESYTYDDNGNLLTSPNRSYTYTPRNLTASATVFVATSTYQYDADDWRVKKQSGTTTTYYLRGLRGELLTEWTNPGPSGTTKDYVYAGSRLITGITRTWTESSDFFGEIIPNGPTVTVSLETPPGRDAKLRFDGVAGQYVSAKGVLTNGSMSCLWGLKVLKPDGTALPSPNGSYTWGCSYLFLQPILLPESGSYTLMLDQGSGNGTGTADLNLYMFAHLTGTIIPSGPSVTPNIIWPGQEVHYTFDGTQGERVSAYIEIQGNYNCGYHLRINKPDGTPLTPLTYSTWGCSYELLEPITLPSTGVYTLVVDPMIDGTGTATLNLYGDVIDQTGTITLNGPSETATISTPGRQAVFTFSGTPGQRVSAYGLVTSGSFGCGGFLGIKKPDGTVMWTPNSGYCGSMFMEPVTLPDPGTYQLIVDPALNQTGVAVINAYDVPPDATGSLTVNGAAIPVSITAPGQQARVTFAGTTGQQVTVSFSGNTITMAGGAPMFVILRPDGGWQTYWWFGDSSFSFPPQALGQTGTYTVVVDPQMMNMGNISVQVTSP